MVSIHSFNSLRLIERMLLVVTFFTSIVAIPALLTSAHYLLVLCACFLAAASWLGASAVGRSKWLSAVLFLVCSSVAAYALLQPLAPGSSPEPTPLSAGYWLLLIAAWCMAWSAVEKFSDIDSLNRWVTQVLSIFIPIVFGIWLLLLWEFLTRGLDVPQVLLPAPSVIGERFVNSTSILWADFKQTFLKAVLIGYALGCLSGFIVAILIDRSPFLQRGLLPVGNLVSALPIVGVAPIMVMWFGFDWPSGASYVQSLVKLRLPEALPFIFNALKINSTLAMIGAIVAEFFGTPTVGMGFRISTEVGRMNVDMVWAEIAVAAIAGSVFYLVLTILERVFTFWHPSIRQ